MKRILFSSLAIVACLLTISGPASAQKLHALIVTDQTKWAQWGKNLPHIQMDSAKHIFVVSYGAHKRERPSILVVPLG